VFDSRLTTYAHLARLDALGITFITLRRRSSRLLDEIKGLPASSWRRVSLDVPARKYKTPRVFEQPVTLAGASLRQLFVLDLGHEEPTILLTTIGRAPRQAAHPLRPAHAHRERPVGRRALLPHGCAELGGGLKVDFDMALLVIASGLYRLLARRMRGYADAQARHIFRDLIDTPPMSPSRGRGPRALSPPRHLPIIIAFGTPGLTAPGALVAGPHPAHERVADTQIPSLLGEFRSMEIQARFAAGLTRRTFP